MPMTVEEMDSNDNPGDEAPVVQSKSVVVVEGSNAGDAAGSKTSFSQSPTSSAGYDGMPPSPRSRRDSMGREYNFEIHGKRRQYSPKSCFLFAEDNPFRYACVWLANHWAFDAVILALILINSIFLAMADYSEVDADGQFKTGNSWRNSMSEDSGLFFTIAFTVEMLVKMVAMGVIVDKGSYLRDAWNWLDAIVVVSAWLEYIPGLPNLGPLRVLRVLRPLKSVDKMPGLKKIVNSLLASIPKLAPVLAFLFFLFFIFGILGMQFWAGVQHSRCRLTDFPVYYPDADHVWPLDENFVENIKLAVVAHKSCLKDRDCTSDGERPGCLGCPLTNGKYDGGDAVYHSKTGTNFSYKQMEYCTYGMSDPSGEWTNEPIKVHDREWTHDSSAWRAPQPCVWPLQAATKLEDQGARVCSKGSGGVFNDCGTWSMPNGDGPYDLTCGSNYDDLGNRRFKGHRLMLGATHIEDLLWGFLNFDEFGSAFLTIFQCVTMEGWTDVMYQLQDGWGGLISALYFVFLILFGSFFVLNLMLAVIWEQFEEMKEKDLAEAARLEELEREVERKEREERKEEERQAEDERKASGSGDAVVPVPSDASAAANTGALAVNAGAAGERTTDENGNVLIDGNRWDNAPFRNLCYKLVQHWIFEGFITTLILLNTLTLAMDKYPMECELNDNLEIINFLLTIIFTIETVLKLIGLGPMDWKKDSFNVFDGFIVFVSLVELGVGQPSFITGVESDPNGSSGALSALRTFRLFRIFKLARSWTELQKLLVAMLKCVAEIGNFSVLLFLFMFIYALVGRQFFAYKFRFDDNGYVIYRFVDCTPAINAESPYSDSPPASECVIGTKVENPVWLATESPRANFDTLLWSFVTIFQILTGENWNTVMYDGWRATGWAAVVYFVSLVVFGAFIVLNLFLAILLGGFDSGAGGEEVPPEKPKPSPSNRVAPAPVPGTASEVEQAFKSAEGVGVVVVPEEEKPAEEPRGEVGSYMPKESSLFIFAADNPVRQWCFKTITHPLFDNAILTLIIISSVLLATDNPLWDPNSWQVKALWVMDNIFTIVFFFEMVLKIIALGFVMHKGSYLRGGWNILDFVIVIISIVALETGRYNPDQKLGAYHPTTGAYVNADAGDPTVKSLRSLRTLRALRPLRMISRNPGLKLVVNALIASIPNILNVVMVVILFFLIFAIVGVNYFKGRFMHCQVDGDGISAGHNVWDVVANPPNRTNPDFGSYWDPTRSMTHMGGICSNKEVEGTCAALTISEDSWTSKQACGCLRICDLASNSDDPDTLDAHSSGLDCVGSAEWTANVPQNFNNAIAGMLALFEMSTTEQWVDVMYAGVDATGIDMQPQVNYSEAWVFFFVAFMIVGSFFMMQLFVGVVIDNFIVLKEKLGGSAFLLTDAQQDWVKMQELMLAAVPTPVERMPKAYLCFSANLRQGCFEFYKRPDFEPFIMGCIIVNTLIMAITYFGEGDTYSLFIESMNYIFAIIFTVECVVKLLALGTMYFNDSWNVFDFVIVVGTNLGILVKYAAGIDVGSVATIVRTFRVGRIFRLINAAPTLKRTFNTLIITMPSLVNIGSLLFLLMFIYAILGVQWYAKVKYGENIKDNANFQDFWTVMLLLVRCSTGENWNGLMYDAMVTDDCVDDPQWDPNVCDFVGSKEICEPINGCGSASAYIYFLSFTTLVTFIMLNVFIAVVLSGWETEDDENMPLKEDQVEEFVEAWQKYDQDATHFITYQQLLSLIQELNEPLGFGPEYEARTAELERRIAELDIPLYTRIQKDQKSWSLGITGLGSWLASCWGGGEKKQGRDVAIEQSNNVFFYDVVRQLGVTLARSHAGLEYQDDNFEDLHPNHDMMKRWNFRSNNKIRKSTQREMDYSVKHYYAAIAIYAAFRNNRFCSALQAKMEELKQRDKGKKE